MIASLTFVAGIGFSTIFHNVEDNEPNGRNLKCVAHGTICVGMPAREAIFRAEDDLGSLSIVYCGFERPEVNVREKMILADAIRRGCSDHRYMLLFSNRNHLTGIWIEDEKVIRLDRSPTSVFDV
jgi:hypothetical protein